MTDFRGLAPEGLEALYRNHSGRLVDNCNASNAMRSRILADRVQSTEQAARVYHVGEHYDVPVFELVGIAPKLWSKEIVGHHNVDVFHPALNQLSRQPLAAPMDGTAKANEDNLGFRDRTAEFPPGLFGDQLAQGFDDVVGQ